MFRTSADGREAETEGDHKEALVGSLDDILGGIRNLEFRRRSLMLRNGSWALYVHGLG